MSSFTPLSNLLTTCGFVAEGTGSGTEIDSVRVEYLSECLLTLKQEYDSSASKTLSDSAKKRLNSEYSANITDLILSQLDELEGVENHTVLLNELVETMKQPLEECKENVAAPVNSKQTTNSTTSKNSNHSKTNSSTTRTTTTPTPSPTATSTSPTNADDDFIWGAEDTTLVQQAYAESGLKSNTSLSDTVSNRKLDPLAMLGEIFPSLRAHEIKQVYYLCKQDINQAGYLLSVSEQQAQAKAAAEKEEALLDCDFPSLAGAEFVAQQQRLMEKVEFGGIKTKAPRKNKHNEKQSSQPSAQPRTQEQSNEKPKSNTTTTTTSTAPAAARDAYYSSPEFAEMKARLKAQYEFEYSNPNTVHKPHLKLTSKPKHHARYLNGQVVNTKGEKYTIIVDKEEEAREKEWQANHKPLKVITKRKGGELMQMTHSFASAMCA